MNAGTTNATAMAKIGWARARATNAKTTAMIRTTNARATAMIGWASARTTNVRTTTMIGRGNAKTTAMIGRGNAKTTAIIEWANARTTEMIGWANPETKEQKKEEHSDGPKIFQAIQAATSPFRNVSKGRPVHAGQNAWATGDQPEGTRAARAQTKVHIASWTSGLILSLWVGNSVSSTCSSMGATAMYVCRGYTRSRRTEVRSYSSLMP
ncbi:hypothetical protein HD554DRAFT_2099427 [Boletus coccyginus]|nr:hypothetical protein HD554DRAFT_2099427 [Boletus coccyginus]